MVAILKRHRRTSQVITRLSSMKKGGVPAINTRLTGTVLLVLCLFVVAAASVSAQGFIYPTAELTSFDAETFTYTYTVTVSEANSFPFGHFRVFAAVPNAGLTGGWVVSDPTVGEQAASGWSTSISRWDYDIPADYVAWQASTEAEVMKGTEWVGVFTLVAPNTRPVDGMLFTSDGPGSEHYMPGQVPGAVPEPSSLMCLFSGSAALLGMLRRRSA